MIFLILSRVFSFRAFDMAAKFDIEALLGRVGEMEEEEVHGLEALDEFTALDDIDIPIPVPQSVVPMLESSDEPCTIQCSLDYSLPAISQQPLVHLDLLPVIPDPIDGFANYERQLEEDKEPIRVPVLSGLAAAVMPTLAPVAMPVPVAAAALTQSERQFGLSLVAALEQIAGPSSAYPGSSNSSGAVLEPVAGPSSAYPGSGNSGAAPNRPMEVEEDSSDSSDSDDDAAHAPPAAPPNSSDSDDDWSSSSSGISTDSDNVSKYIFFIILKGKSGEKLRSNMLF